MHSQDVIHRDIKPENILIKAGLGGFLVDLKISDLGHSCLLYEQHTASRRFGTVGYIAPEVLNKTW